MEVTEEDLKRLDWAVIGAESGHKRRECKIEDVRSVVKQCAIAGIPAFVKQLHIPDTFPIEKTEYPERYKMKPSKDMAEWPADLRIQQYPAPARQERA